jgi:hypothetical protein
MQQPMALANCIRQVHVVVAQCHSDMLAVAAMLEPGHVIQ